MADEKPKPDLKLPPETFTRIVTVPKEDRNGMISLDSDQKPVVGRTLGSFTFKIPALRTRLRIGTRRAIYLGSQTIQSLDAETVLIGECCAALPLVIVDAPHGWPKTEEEWEGWFDRTLVADDRALYALYSAYQEGVRLFRDARNEGSAA
jgi:hypothetical protein